MKVLLTELRLLICSWLFVLVVLVAPKNNPEGLLIVTVLKSWAEASSGSKDHG